MLNNGKAKLSKTMHGFTISIPSKKNWAVLIFMTAWLGGWLMGFLAVTRMLLGDLGNIGANLFVLFWLIGWTAGGGMAIAIVLWGYFGVESFILDRSTISLERTVFGIGRKNKMEVSHIKNFRTELSNSSWFGSNRMAFWGLGEGKIKFDYGLKTHSFGLAIDDAEAVYLTDYLNNELATNE